MNMHKDNGLLSSSSIKGTSVRNPKNENIGSIEDLMIDLESGEVNYAVLSVNTGFLNMGSKYFAIPLEEFSFNRSMYDNEAVLAIDKERLENAPGFDKDNWPNGPQHEFVNEVHKYFGRNERYTKDDDGQFSSHSRSFGSDTSFGSDQKLRGNTNEGAADQTGRASTNFNKPVF